MGNQGQTNFPREIGTFHLPSGNGAHLLFRVDLPNDEDAATLIRDCLQALAERFDNEYVCVDIGNYNAARVWKLYGTVAVKGDHLPDRPHRLSKLLHVPASIGIVPVEKLETLAGVKSGSEAAAGGETNYFDVGQWLDKHGIGVRSCDENFRGQLGPGTKWVLEQCVWNPEHTDKSAFVIQFRDGPIAAGCQHNTCAGKNWHDFRAQVEGQQAGAATDASDSSDLRHKRHKSGGTPHVAPITSLKTLMAHGRSWPAPPDPAAFHGLAGDVVRAIEPHSEADPVAILIQFLTAFGNAVGRTAHFQVESDRHFLKLFNVLVGRTSKARKGTSWGHVLRLFQMADEQWAAEHVANGLSSGEGLIWAVRDEQRKRKPRRGKDKAVGFHEVISDEGVKDKRFLCIESEYASTLKVAGREGNTLSPVVRNAWDSGNLRTLTKNNPARATATHISIIGHITEEELRRYLTTTEACNGFGNRFLWLCVKRSKYLPDGGGLTDQILRTLASRVSDALEAARWIERMERDEITNLLWATVYPELSREQPGLFGALTSRAEAQTMRLACIYAALDQSVMIRQPHLEAALATWGYAEDSVRYIFIDAVGDPVADEILVALRQHPQGMSRNDIRILFGRHCSAAQISAALIVLSEHGLAHSAKEKTKGRSKEMWFETRSAP